jgi:hypothetical protein
VIDQPLDRLGDLVLAPPRGLECLRGLDDRVVEQVHAHERQIRDVLLRFLHEPHDSLAIEDGNAETLGLGNVCEEDLRVRACPLELLHEAGEPLEQHVVAEVHEERLARHELARRQHRVGQAEGGVLPDVGDAHPPPGAVADRGSHLVGGGAHDEAHLDDPRVADRLDRAKQDRLSRDGKQLLRARVGDGSKPRSLAPREDERAHQRLGRVDIRGSLPRPLRRTIRYGAGCSTPAAQSGAAGAPPAPTGAGR